MQGSGTKSILGYSRNSPYKNDPFIDIFTPEGVIDMSNTDKDLVGIDEYGNTQLMLANSGNPYMFPGQQVREIPISKAGGLSPAKAKEMLKDNSANGKKLTKAQVKYFQAVAHGWKPSKQKGGAKNPYQVGGTLNDLFNFLFEDDDQTSSSPDMPTAPSTDELDQREEMLNERQRQLDEQEQYNLAMQIAGEDFPSGNPYKDKTMENIRTQVTPTSYSNISKSQINPDSYLAAIFGNEGGKTGVDPAIRGTASGKYAIIKSGRRDLYKKYYSSTMSYEQFEKNYNTNPQFEYNVAKRLAQENINSSSSLEEAIGRWYSPAHAASGNWDVIPRPDYGNKLTVRQYINKAIKNYK